MTTLSLSRSPGELHGPRRPTREAARHWRTELLLLTATFALCAFYYIARADLVGTRGPGGAWTAVTAPARSPSLHFGAAALLLGLVPLAAARWGCGISFRDLGLGLGNRRAGLRWLAVGLPAAILAGWIASGSPAMRAVYPLDPSVVGAPLSFVPHALRNLLYFGAWEVLFRGVLLFGLRETIGSGGANSTQTGLSVAAHFGRPMTETFAAIPAGLAFGAIALQTKSIWYVTLIHWSVGTSMDWFIVAGA